MKKKKTIQIPNVFKPFQALGNYLSNHLQRAKSEADAEKRVLSSLNIVGRTLLIVGLITSLVFIVPTIFQIAGGVLPFWLCLTIALVSCALYAALIDLSIGVNVPYMFFKIVAFFQKPNLRTLFKAAPVALLVYGQVSLSMYFSWSGNTHTTAYLLQDEDPRENSSIITSLDSAKHQAEKTIRENAEDVLKEAKALDNSKFKEARDIMKAARHQAKKQFPLHTSNNWQKERYNKIISKARQDSSDVVFNVMNYEVALNKLEAKVYESNNLHNHNIDTEKAKQKKKVEAFERKLATYRLLMRDLGYWSTLGFVVISLIIVLVSPAPTPSSSKGKQEAVEDYPEEKQETVEDIRRYLSQDINRINEAIAGGKDTSTYAKNIVDKFGRIKAIDLPYYENLVKEYQKFYTNKFGQDAVYDDTSAMFYI
jgi:hypothetical protein